MIVIAAYSILGVPPDPVNTGRGLQGIIDQVSQTKTNIMRFVDGLQGRPIAVNVGHQQYPHEGEPNYEEIEKTLAFVARLALYFKDIKLGGQPRTFIGYLPVDPNPAPCRLVHFLVLG
jgi:hypothetical protein